MAKESHSHGSGKDNREVPVGHHLVLKKEKKKVSGSWKVRVEGKDRRQRVSLQDLV